MPYSTVDRTAYTALVDDSGSGTDGSVWDKADVNDILNTVDGLFSGTFGLQCNGPLRERNRTANVGEWTTPTYAGGNFTSSSGTWTVDSGDVTTYAYTVIGKTMILAVFLLNTSVTGTPATLRIAIPGGFTAAKAMRAWIETVDNGGTPATGMFDVAAAGTYVTVYRDLSGTAWSASTNATHVIGTITFEVS